MKKVWRSYKYRLYPIKEQIVKFEEILETCRQLYNNLLAERIKNQEEQRVLPKNFRYYITRFDQYKGITQMKKSNDYLANTYTTILQDVADRIDRGVNKFLRNGSGYPKFKRYGNYFSFTFKVQAIKPKRTNPFYYFKIHEKSIEIRRIGQVKAKISREIPEHTKIKYCMIRRSANKWYAMVCIEYSVPTPKKTFDLSNAIGIDVGTKDYAILSNGERFENPKWYREMEKKLRHEHRSLSRKVKGSSNYKKQCAKIVSLEKSVGEKRRDYLHKLSTHLINKYSIIFHEALLIENMRKNRYLAKSISDVGWGIFFELLRYKAEEHGKIVLKVDYKGTSQVCSNCDEKVPKTLRARWHTCFNCGLKIDRDVNSANVILKRGLLLLQSSNDNTAGLAGSACGVFKEGNETRSSI